MATPLDPPQVCDFWGMVRFSTDWTGLDPAMVEKVLSAKERYMELAGISECEEDEPLQLEREAFRHLLPKTPNCLDERATKYLALTAGCDEETIHRIEQGELAYLESLGLVTWGDDDERDRELGSPVLREAQSIEAEDDESVFESHGDHWECLVPAVGRYIQELLSEPLSAVHLRFCVPSPDPLWENVTVRAIPQAPELETWRLDGFDGAEEEIISAFPVVRDGSTHSLLLHRVGVWKEGCEAIVHASTTFGASIDYFDTAFLHPWNEWEPGEKAEIQLAAFAFRLELAPDQAIQITDEETVRAMRAIQDSLPAEEVMDLSPIEIHSKDVASFFHRQGGNPDDFEFQGPVVRVDEVLAWGQVLFRVEVTIMRDTSGAEILPFIIPVYVAEATLAEDYRPQPGQSVRGHLWLQGCPAGLSYPVIRGE